MESTKVIYFKVSKVMHVVGIGHIVTGQSGNGKIKPGATIMLNDDQQQAFIVDALEQI